MDWTQYIIVYLLCISSLSIAEITVTDSIQVLDVGPTAQINCKLNASEITQPTFTWKFENKTLAVNETLKDVNATRHSMSIFFQGDYIVSQIQIINMLKADAGTYQCKVNYFLHETLQTEIGDTKISVIYYLPDSNYPECSIQPSFNESDILLICEVGESFPPVRLNLTLERQDGTLTQLGNTSTTRTINFEDDGAMFVCQMTSGKFPTANRMCFAGPLTVVKPPHPYPSTTLGSLIPSSPPRSSLMPSPSPPRSSLVPLPSSSSQMTASSSTSNILLWSLVGGLLASFVILLIVALTINRIQHLRTAKASKPNLAISPWKSDIRDTSKTHSSKPSVNQCSTGARQTPIYAVVHKENSSSRDSVRSLDTTV